MAELEQGTYPQEKEAEVSAVWGVFRGTGCGAKAAMWTHRIITQEPDLPLGPWR